MSGLFQWMLRSSIYLLVFYLVYWLFLSRDTAYTRNRIYLLLSVLASFALPLISVPGTGQISQSLFGRWLPDVIIQASPGESRNGSAFLTGLLPGILNTIYITGILISILRFLADAGNLVYLILIHRDEPSRIIRFHSFNTAGFSALGYIFLNQKLSEDEAEEIRRHEENHLRQLHSLDVMLLQIASAFQWFNPAIHLLNRSLRAVHEYQADNDCLRTGISVVGYQSLLLRQVFMTRPVKLSNSFSNPSLTRKRMIMMTRKRSTALSNLKILAALPLVALSYLALTAWGTSPALPAPGNSALTTKGAGDEESPYVVVEQMPMFPGGDQELLKYISTHTVYPEYAKKNNIQGRVIVRFCVTSKGTVDQISILQGADPVLNEEAIRVTGTLPAFKPGMQSGRAVPVWYMIPVTFSLR